MIKLVYCVARREDISEQEFFRYWKEEHGALVRSLASALKARRYVQSHTIAGDTNAMIRASRNSGEAFDGITELWWDNAEDLAAALGSEEGVAADRALAEDEAKFIDFSRSSIFLTEEHTIFER